jgi:hypothetical protein
MRTCIAAPEDGRTPPQTCDVAFSLTESHPLQAQESLVIEVHYSNTNAWPNFPKSQPENSPVMIGPFIKSFPIRHREVSGFGLTFIGLTVKNPARTLRAHFEA